MLKSVTAKLLKDVLGLINQNQNFFELSESDRKALLNGLPEMLKQALLQVNEVDFVASLELFLLNKKAEAGDLAFAKALALAVSEEIANNATQYQLVNSAKSVQSLLNRVFDTNHYLVVQSPIELTKEQKAEVRGDLVKKYGPSAFPLFQVNQMLIGGLRVFYNGEVQDLSWLGRINILTSIVS